MTTKSIEVVDRETDEVVHRVNVEGKSERMIDRVIGGMEINLNEQFFLRRSSRTAGKVNA